MKQKKGLGVSLSGDIDEKINGAFISAKSSKLSKTSTVWPTKKTVLGEE